MPLARGGEERREARFAAHFPPSLSPSLPTGPFHLARNFRDNA